MHCTHCGHVDGGGLCLSKTLSSLLVQKGGVNVAEPSEHFLGSGTDGNTRRIWAQTDEN